MTTVKPPIASLTEWRQARHELLMAEKEATRALDALAARRRRLPSVEYATRYVFDAPGGKKTLVDLFEGRDRLVTYQFMDVGPDRFCPGCTAFTNNVPPAALGMLANNGVSWATISDMPLSQIQPYQQKMGWTMPFVSSRGTTFPADCVEAGFVLSAWLRDGERVFRTYETQSRGVDGLMFSNGILDLTVYGRPAPHPRRS